MSEELQNFVLHVLRDLRSELSHMRPKVREGFADVRSEMHSLRADVASDQLTARRESGEQIAGVRCAVVEYHTSVIGHGHLISDLEVRLRRVENRLGLADPH